MFGLTVCIEFLRFRCLDFAMLHISVSRPKTIRYYELVREIITVEKNKNRRKKHKMSKREHLLCSCGGQLVVESTRHGVEQQLVGANNCSLTESWEKDIA